MQYHEAGKDRDEKTPEIAALKQELSRMMIGTHPEFSRLVDNYITLDDLFAIRDRLIGSGRIGGKAAGMLLARRILMAEPGRPILRRSSRRTTPSISARMSFSPSW